MKRGQDQSDAEVKYFKSCGDFYKIGEQLTAIRLAGGAETQETDCFILDNDSDSDEHILLADQIKSVTALVQPGILVLRSKINLKFYHYQRFSTIVFKIINYRI